MRVAYLSLENLYCALKCCMASFHCFCLQKISANAKWILSGIKSGYFSETLKNLIFASSTSLASNASTPNLYSAKYAFSSPFAIISRHFARSQLSKSPGRISYNFLPLLRRLVRIDFLILLSLIIDPFTDSTSVLKF